MLPLYFQELKTLALHFVIQLKLLYRVLLEVGLAIYGPSRYSPRACPPPRRIGARPALAVSVWLANIEATSAPSGLGVGSFMNFKDPFEGLILEPSLQYMLVYCTRLSKHGFLFIHVDELLQLYCTSVPYCFL